MRAIAAPSCGRGAKETIRVYPPGRSLYVGPMSSIILLTAVLVLNSRAICRRAARLPVLALVTMGSINMRKARALALVVRMEPCKIRLTANVRSRASRWAFVRPSVTFCFLCLIQINIHEKKASP